MGLLLSAAIVALLIAFTDTSKAKYIKVDEQSYAIITRFVSSSEFSRARQYAD